MRKISLLFVLITVALLSSCVDDKESATVEQIRTAKTEWLKAQAEMLQAQGEAQKLLAEIEKLKVENEAKNEAARLEIERLIAEANAAKTEAEAEKLLAEAEKIRNEAKAAEIANEYQQKIYELEYETRKAEEAYKQQDFLNKLNAAIIAGKLNPELEQMYADYVKALRKLRNNQNEIANNEDRVNRYKNLISDNFEVHLASFQEIIKENQEKVTTAKEAIAELEASKTLTDAAIEKKINELNTKLEELTKELDSKTAEMINTADEAKKLLKAICDAKQAVETAKQEAITKEKAYEKAKEDYNSNPTKKLISPFDITVVTSKGTEKTFSFPGYPEFEQNITTKIAAEKDRQATAIKEATTAKEGAEKELAETKANLGKLEKAATDAKAALAPLEEIIKEQKTKLEKATKDKATYEGKVNELNNKKTAAQTDYDAKKGVVVKYTNELKDPDLTPEKKAELEALLGVAKTNEAKALAELTKASDAVTANDAALATAKKDIADATKALEENETAYEKAKENVTITQKAYNDAVAAVSEINQGELVVKVQEAIDELEIATLLADEFNTIVDNAAKTTETLLAEMNQAKADWDEAVANIEATEQKKEEAEAALENSAYTTLIREANELSSQIERINHLLEILTSSDIEGINEQIETYKKEIKTAEEAIAKAEQSIKEFNALASDEEKNEELEACIRIQNEEYQAEINVLNNEISKLKEIQPELQARVDRLQAAIDAAEAALAE